MKKWNDFGIGVIPDAIKNEYISHTVYPPKSQVFSAFELTPFVEVKVVILGQDPYHGEGQANGLAFSVQDGAALPPSLKNIFKEMKNPTKSGDLRYLAKQGVLMVNTVLTVRSGEANSHKGLGWEQITDNAIMALNQRETPIIFLLWGNNALQKKSLITNPNHLVLTSVHPSPLSARRGFFGCDHFKLTNDFLTKTGQFPIDWLNQTVKITND